MDREFWERRIAARQNMNTEDRKVAALEDIADQLLEIEEAVRRIADNAPAVIG